MDDTHTHLPVGPRPPTDQPAASSCSSSLLAQEEENEERIQAEAERDRDGNKTRGRATGSCAAACRSYLYLSCVRWSHEPSVGSSLLLFLYHCGSAECSTQVLSCRNGTAWTNADGQLGVKKKRKRTCRGKDVSRSVVSRFEIDSPFPSQLLSPLSPCLGCFLPVFSFRHGRLLLLALAGAVRS